MPQWLQGLVVVPDWVKRLVAGPELDELALRRATHSEFRKWMGPLPDVARVLDEMQAVYDGRPAGTTRGSESADADETAAAWTIGESEVPPPREPPITWKGP